MTASTDDPDLKRVLDELKGLWNFKSYRVESPSFMTVKDGSGSNFLRLISDIMPYNLIIMHPKVRGDEPGSESSSSVRFSSKSHHPINQAVQRSLMPKISLLRKKAFLS